MSQPPAPAQMLALAEQAVALAHAVLDGYRKAYPTLWEPLNTRGLDGGSSSPAWSDPTYAAAGNAALDEKRRWAATAADRLQRAVQILEHADEAIGNIGLVTNRHREDQRTSAWDKPITADTPPDEVPRDLAEAHAALRRREMAAGPVELPTPANPNRRKDGSA